VVTVAVIFVLIMSMIAMIAMIVIATVLSVVVPIIVVVVVFAGPRHGGRGRQNRSDGREQRDACAAQDRQAAREFATRRRLRTDVE
jgi:hypothetical protein